MRYDPSRITPSLVEVFPLRIFRRLSGAGHSFETDRVGRGQQDWLSASSIFDIRNARTAAVSTSIHQPWQARSQIL